MFDELEKIHQKPKPFEVFTTVNLWADHHRSEKMLGFHLNENIDASSRNVNFVGRSAKWIASTFKLGKNRSVCDFGCGPGLYTSRFAALGARVTGIDFSERSLDYAKYEAKQDGLQITYLLANYLELGEAIDKFDLITMIMCDFCALSPKQRQILLRVFDKNLAKGGKVLLDVYSIPAFDQKQETAFLEKNQLNHFWFDEEYYAFVNKFKYATEKVTLDKYSLFTKSGKQETVFNWLQHFDLISLKKVVAAAGFGVKAYYADVAGTPYSPDGSEFAVVLEKRKE